MGLRRHGGMASSGSVLVWGSCKLLYFRSLLTGGQLGFFPPREMLSERVKFWGLMCIGLWPCLAHLLIKCLYRRHRDRRRQKNERVIGEKMSEETPLFSEKRNERKCGQHCRCGERPHLELWHGYKAEQVGNICMTSAILALPVAAALRKGVDFLQNWMLGR